MSENEENRKWPSDVLERLRGYAERTGVQVGEAANEFKAWLKNEYSVDDPLAEDEFYLSQWSEQFVIETRNLGGSRSSGRETTAYVGMLLGIEDTTRDQRANAKEAALNLYKSNRDRAIDEGHIGIVTAKEGMWYVNGKVTNERVDGSNLPWFGFEHGDSILCLLNTRNEGKPMAPTSVSRTAYFLGSEEGSNDIKQWRINLSNKSMDADYQFHKACRIQVIPPSQEGRDTLYTNRDFHETIEYTDNFVPEHLRAELRPERFLVNDQMHSEVVDLSELAEVHTDRKVQLPSGVTLNPTVIVKGFVSLLNKEPMNSEYDATGRSYRMSVTSLALQSRNGRDSMHSSVTVWIPGRLHDEHHPFEFTDDNGNLVPYAERTQVILFGRLKMRPYNNEMLPSIGLLGIHVPSRTARPGGGAGTPTLNQFGGDQ